MSSSPIFRRREVYEILNGEEISHQGASAGSSKQKDGIGGLGDIPDSMVLASAEIDPHSMQQDRSLFQLSAEHEAFVRAFILDLHAVATQSDQIQLPQIVRLGTFFSTKHGEVLQKYREENLSSIAVLKFLYSNEELRGKVIEGMDSLNIPSWVAIRSAIWLIYNPVSEPRIRGEVYAFCTQDPIAIAQGWKGEKMMLYITGKDPYKLMQYMFLGIES